MYEKTMRINKRQLHRNLAYRIPMQVAELYIQKNGNAYYACPRCHITLERDFSAYCDRCGQCLNWSQYRNAECHFI